MYALYGVGIPTVVIACHNNKQIRFSDLLFHRPNFVVANHNVCCLIYILMWP